MAWVLLTEIPYRIIKYSSIDGDYQDLRSNWVHQISSVWEKTVEKGQFRCLENRE